MGTSEAGPGLLVYDNRPTAPAEQLREGKRRRVSTAIPAWALQLERGMAGNGGTHTSDVVHKYACAELIQAWGLCRDQGRWAELLATFTPDGQIAVSWFSGEFSEFVDRCRRAFEAGQRSKHRIFPSVVRVAANRALAETNIVILVRQKIGGVLTD